MRIIDADKLIEKLSLDNITFHYGDDYEMAEYVKENINQAPTVDLWHYPSRGEYPTEKELVLMKIPGCYVLGWYDAGNWFIDDGELTVLKCNVSRWQYIIPPKEEA